MTDQLDLDAIRARYQRVLDAKPSKRREEAGR